MNGRSVVTLALLAMTLFAAEAANAQSQNLPAPDQKGPYNVGTYTFSATMTGGRVTRVQVFYPTLAAVDPTSVYTINTPVGTYDIRSPLGAVHDAAVAPGPFPLVVFDHGGQPAGRDAHRITELPLHETMASHGIIIAVAPHSADAVVRTLDLKLMIDLFVTRATTGGDFFFQTIDPNRIGISGFSTGGGAALSLAGGWSANGIGVDSRIKAMVVFEPRVNTLDDAPNVAIPYLVMGGLQYRNGLAVPALFEATTAAAPRIYVQSPRAAHFCYETGMQDETDQAREQALSSNPTMPDPLTTLNPSNAAAARAYELWNFGQLQYLVLGQGVGGARNLCDRVGVNSIRSLDLDGDGYTDSPPFLLDDPPYMPARPLRSDVMTPMIKLYTVAFWKVHLTGDHRYQRYLAPGYAQRNDFEANVFVAE